MRKFLAHPGMAATPGEDGRRTYEHGVVVGKRHPQTGRTYCDLSDPSWGDVDPPSFRPTGSVTVYLVAYSLHRRHVMCLPGQITRGE